MNERRARTEDALKRPLLPGTFVWHAGKAFMVDPVVTVWTLRDGKRGHENQVLGLAEALERRGGFTIENVSLPHEESFRQRLSRMRKTLQGPSRPRLIIAAGHSTHLLLLYAARLTGARSIPLISQYLSISLNRTANGNGCGISDNTESSQPRHQSKRLR